jgi:hypothetical protein
MNWLTKAMLFIGTGLLSYSCIETPAPWVPNGDTSKVEIAADTDSVHEDYHHDNFFLYDTSELIGVVKDVPLSDPIEQKQLVDYKVEEGTITDTKLTDSSLDCLIDVKEEISDVFEQDISEDLFDLNTTDIITDNNPETNNETFDLTEVSSPIITPYILDMNTVVLMHFNEPNPFEIQGQVSGDLTDYNTTVVESLEEFGQALHFDGISYLSTPYNSKLEAKDAITLEILIKPDWPTNSFTGDFGNILTKAGSDDGKLEGYILFIGNGHVGATVGVNEGELNQITVPYELPTDDFTHLAFTYDGSFMKMFINGVLKKEQECVGQIYYSTTIPLRIGGYGAPNSFIGVIDEVRISDVAREF